MNQPERHTKAAAHPQGAASRAFDLVVIGGGVNGAGVAYEAAARGVATALLESRDFASGTSSRSSKLIHGGLRYLEYGDFRLVREALGEREELMRKAPHLIWPLRFVIPVVPGGRPAWMIRAGLFLYDQLAPRRSLATTQSIDLRKRGAELGLRPEFKKAYAYSDCWVDDARLVIANVLGAARSGACIMPRTRFVNAQRVEDEWRIRIVDEDTGQASEIGAKVIVNAAGPWAVAISKSISGVTTNVRANLVRGSHIVVPKLYDGPHATMLQVGDGRVVVTMPYEGEYTLVGTTDETFDGDPGAVAMSVGERDYLLGVIRRFFLAPREAEDIRWSYSGVRPLFEEGKSRDGDPTTATRDYAFRIDRGTTGAGAPILTVLGGKLTTYRKLSAHAFQNIAPFMSYPLDTREAPDVPLPGGEIDKGGPQAYAVQIASRYPFLSSDLAARYARTYGSRTAEMLGSSGALADLGQHFGADLFQREVDFLVRTEWAANTDDILWRRTKCGLRFNSTEEAGLADYLAQEHDGALAADVPAMRDVKCTQHPIDDHGYRSLRPGQ